MKKSQKRVFVFFLFYLTNITLFFIFFENSPILFKKYAKIIMQISAIILFLTLFINKSRMSSLSNKRISQENGDDVRKVFDRYDAGDADAREVKYVITEFIFLITFSVFSSVLFVLGVSNYF